MGRAHRLDYWQMTHPSNKVELLAPAGSRAALEAVLEQGADAVYLAGKEYNMRRHRSDFNFSLSEIEQAANKIHGRGAKLYVTVNSLLRDEEIEGVPSYLRFLASAGADAIIVQDLGLVQLARSLKLPFELHASTMMNIHSPAGACLCAELGFSRIICSRDITLAQLKEMAGQSGLEMECFVHGDMCIAQSGQCYSSGVLFGSSSNRGKCMKPCRWAYELVDLQTGTALPSRLEGPHLLAIKDLCLVQFIPELLESGVTSLKIEGRMRPPDLLAGIVRAYRTAIDAYLNDPAGYVNDPSVFEALYRKRVREFSTCSAFKLPDADAIDATGRREPLFLSTAAKERRIDLQRPDRCLKNVCCAGQGDTRASTRPQLAVHCGSPQACRAALQNGADWIYFGGEVSVRRGQRWNIDQVRQTIEAARKLNRKVGLLTPRVTLGFQLRQIHWLLEQLRPLPPDAILVHNLGSLHTVRGQTETPVFGDFSLNVVNRQSLALLRCLGATQAALSVEASFETLREIAGSGCLPVECIVHGPLTGMYLEHCLISLAMGNTSSRKPCRGPCRHLACGLRNRQGDIYRIEPDQYCKTHLLLAGDVACINYLDLFCRAGAASLRIEAQYYDADETGLVTQLYAGALASEAPGYIDKRLLRRLVRRYPRHYSLGAYDRGLFQEQREQVPASRQKKTGTA